MNGHEKKQAPHKQESNLSESATGESNKADSTSAKFGGAMPLYTQTQTGVAEGLELNQSQPGGADVNPGLELLRQSLQRMLEKQQLMERVNGAAARELARAFLRRDVPKTSTAELHATPYYADKVNPGPAPAAWTEDEVYKALVGAMDISRLEKSKYAVNWLHKLPATPNAGGGSAVNQLGLSPSGQGLHATPYFADKVKPRLPKSKADKSPKWELNPASSQPGTRDDAMTETLRAAEKHYLGGTTFEEILDSKTEELAKKAAVKLTVEWLTEKGLTIAAELESGIGTILGVFELTCSVLELLIVLTKPQKRAMSKDEQIVADVRSWLESEMGAAE